MNYIREQNKKLKLQINFNSFCISKVEKEWKPSEAYKAFKERRYLEIKPGDVPEGFKFHFKDYYFLRVLEVIHSKSITEQNLQFVRKLEIDSSGTKFTGYTKNNIPECLGIEERRNELVYIGEFKNGKVHGYGKAN